MDCETCSELLLDLHYDELDAARADEVRAHLTTCDACSAASARLGRTRSLVAGLALPDAPQPSAAVMAALSATVPAVERVSAVIPIARARQARATGWLQRVGEVAMRRQVAMAAISMLMFGLGLRYLPFRSPTQSMTAEAPQTEVVPATELAPAPVSAAPTPAPAGAMPLAMRRPIPPLRAQSQATAPTEGRAYGRIAAGEPARPTSVADGRGVVAEAPAADDLEARADAVRGVVRARSAAAPAASNSPASAGFASNTLAASEERQLQTALPAEPAAAPAAIAATGSGLGSAPSDRGPTRGELASEIGHYQQQLAANPPPAERVAIARSLQRALLRAGRIEEANRVQAEYLTRAADTTSLAGQVGTSPVRPPAAAAMPSPARPVVTRPARRSVSNAQSDFNQSAY